VISGYELKGLPELRRLSAAAGREAKKRTDDALRQVAEPIRADAEALAVSSIPRVGVAWSRMRVGVTNRAVYVAPRKRGARGRDNPRRRPRFADLLEQRAMTPALDRNRDQIESRVEAALQTVADGWNRTG